MAAKPGRSSSGLAPCCAPLGFAKISENREHRTRREFWPENSRKNRKSWAWFGLHEFTISSSGPRGSESTGVAVSKGWPRFESKRCPPGPHRVRECDRQATQIAKSIG